MASVDIRFNSTENQMIFIRLCKLCAKPKFRFHCCVSMVVLAVLFKQHRLVQCYVSLYGRWWHIGQHILAGPVDSIASVCFKIRCRTPIYKNFYDTFKFSMFPTVGLSIHRSVFDGCDTIDHVLDDWFFDTVCNFFS